MSSKPLDNVLRLLIHPCDSTPFIDPAQFRERLETIVRKKEGCVPSSHTFVLFTEIFRSLSRMVNVIPKYRSRDPSTNFSSNQRNRSRISSGISSLRTRSVSASDSAQDSDSAIVSPALPDNMDGNQSERNDNEGGTSNESEELPSIVIPVPVCYTLTSFNHAINRFCRGNGP